MKLKDNMEIQAEALKRIGFPPRMDAAPLTTPNFYRLLEQMTVLKERAGPCENVVICKDCSAVHDCPFGARHENAFDHRRVCGSCGSRTGFRDVVGRWVPFAETWKPWTWGKGCWAFDFCTSPGHQPDGKKVNAQ